MSAKSALLTDIVNNHRQALRSYIIRRVGNTDDADDILQDVFYRLARCDDSEISGIERMSSWLYKVAHNAIINLWRKRREEPWSSAADSDDVYDYFAGMLSAPPADDPENICLRKVIWQELEVALAALPPEQSEVFCLTVFEGIPVKEIAANTGVPQATVLSRKHYAVKYIRTRLLGLYQDILDY